MKIVTTERLVFDKGERETKKTWGNDWPRIWKDIKKYGGVAILTGTWSGYTASQSRIAHSEYVPWIHADGMHLRTIVFTDGTTLRVEIRAYTIEQILEWKIRRIRAYDELIREARGAMVETFYVGQDNAPIAVEKSEPEPATATPEPVEEKQ